MRISIAKDVKVAKWGRSLAVRLPQAFAAVLGGAGSRVRLIMIKRNTVSPAMGGFGEREQAAIADACTETMIGKWGNSLGVRLPVGITSELGLKEGDMVTLSADGTEVAVARQRARAEALESFLSLRGLISGSVRFSREDLLLRGLDVED